MPVLGTPLLACGASNKPASFVRMSSDACNGGNAASDNPKWHSIPRSAQQKKSVSVSVRMLKATLDMVSWLQLRLTLSHKLV